MNILVTGATGHVGNVLVRRLAEQGHALRVLVMPGENVLPLHGVNATICCCDVRNAEQVQRAVHGCTDVFHLAGIIDITSRNAAPIYEVNVGGTRNIVAACLKEGVRRLVYTSSIHALPDDGQLIDETLAGTCASDSMPDPYARSKAMALEIVTQAARKGLNVVSVFPTGIIGPCDYRMSEMGRLLHHITAHPKARSHMYFDGAYDFVDVRDVVDGLLAAWQLGKAGEGYILSGHYVTIAEIYTAIRSAMGASFTLKRVPLWLVRFAAKLAPTLFRIARQKPLLTPTSINVLLSGGNISCEKARRNLGYVPRPFQQTIDDAVRWMQAHYPAKARRSRTRKRRMAQPSS